MQSDHDRFLHAIRAKKLVRVKFVKKANTMSVTRICAPLDYGPRRRSADQSDCYHFWDLEGSGGGHSMSLTPDQILGLEVLPDTFEPSDFVTWDTRTAPWHLARQWGAYS